MPGLYAVLHSFGVIPQRAAAASCGAWRARRPSGCRACRGSRPTRARSAWASPKGAAWPGRSGFLGRGGRVVVMTGDGELQEGQNYEALQAAAHEGIGNLTVIVDRNKVQSDRLTEEILELGDLEEKLRSFGWHVARLQRPRPRRAARGVRGIPLRAERPKVLIARDDQGQGRLVHGASARSARRVVGPTAGTRERRTTTRSAAPSRSSPRRIGRRLAAHELGALVLEPVAAARRRAAQASLEGEPASGAGAPRPS